MLYIIAQTFLSLLIPSGSVLVIGLDGLASVLRYAVLHSSRATPSLTKLYAIEFLFFFKFEPGNVFFRGPVGYIHI